MRYMHMQILISIAITLLAVVLVACGGNDKSSEIPMTDLVPTQIQGWTLDGEPQTYDRETIFDYIDGAGEVYLSYGFRAVMVFHFVRPDNPEITVEIFDMGAAEDAYGVFSHARMAAESGIGQEYEYRGSLLSFWKGRYYVCVLAERQTPESKEAVFAMARDIDKRIPQTGSKPNIVSLLPEQDRISGNVHFFHVHASLNYHYFLAEDNILNLDETTDAALVRYEPESICLVCIEYPDSSSAEVAFRRFIAEYVPEAELSGAAQIEQDRWVVADQAGPYVVIALDAPDRESARELVNTCIENISATETRGR